MIELTRLKPWIWQAICKWSFDIEKESSSWKRVVKPWYQNVTLVIGTWILRGLQFLVAAEDFSMGYVVVLVFCRLAGKFNVAQAAKLWYRRLSSRSVVILHYVLYFHWMLFWWYWLWRWSNWICDFSELRAFLSFKDFAELIAVCLERFWSHLNDFGNVRKIGEVFQGFFSRLDKVW